jgi:hypothetical protein
MNPPIFSEGGLKEDFNYSLKPAYMTLWIQTLFSHTNALQVQLFFGSLLRLYFETAKVQPLDYRQKLTIDQTEVWLIDNGATICLLLPEEY